MENIKFDIDAVIEEADGSLVAMEMYSLDDAIITLEYITPFIR